MNETNFIQSTAESFMSSMNDQVAIIIINEIDKLIGLEQIIADDLANRIASFEEAKNATKDEDIKNAMQAPTLDFPTIISKLEYAFKALIHKGYTFTHDINPSGVITVRFFEQKYIKKFILNTKYNVSFEEYIEPIQD